MSTTRKVFLALFLTLAAFSAVGSGCYYGGVAAVNENTVVILRNDSFLFGLLREVYVCKVSDQGLVSCAVGTSP